LPMGMRVAAGLIGLACLAGVTAEAQSGSVEVPGVHGVIRAAGTDAESGIRYVRLTVVLAGAESDSSAPAHFTMECTEAGGKRELNWYVSFGGVEVGEFAPPFRPTPERKTAPANPREKLTMTFEGYRKWKPMTREWEVLPSGELRYLKPGMHSGNMEEARAYLPYLSALSSLRIGYASRQPSMETVIQTRPLLDEVMKTDICGR
jgi:hypothetical protein